MIHFFRFLAPIALASLTACGGGGGGTTAATVTAPVVPVAANIVTSIPAPSYAGATEELAAFNLLNAERSRCGFGMLAQNSQLDVAAKGHADWLLTNNYSGHFQVTGTPLFTGVTPKDRILAAGYSGSGTESEYDSNGAKIGQGIVGIRRLLNAPYHLVSMMGGYRDVGIAARDKSDLGLPNTRHVLNIDFGVQSSSTMQAGAAGSIRTYPCDGSILVERSLTNESPNPVPGRNLAASPLGTSVAVVIDVGHTLVISTATMVNAVTGAAVVIRSPITSANDPNAVPGLTYLRSNEGFISADAPLDAGIAYKVTITGSDNGVAFRQPVSFTFTTGL